MALFRQEALDQRGERLYGEVNLALPSSWQAIGFLLLGIVVSSVLFLSLTGFSRVETVKGAILPQEGISRISPSRGGVVTDLYVKEGQVVSKGTPIALISTDETLLDGSSIADEVLSSLGAEERELVVQGAQLRALTTAEDRQISARIAGLQEEIRGYQQRIELQQELVNSAQEQLEVAERISARGFISRSDILQREESLLNRQQQLTQLKQSLAQGQAALREARATMSRNRANAEVQLSALASMRADVSQRRTGAKAAGAYRIDAPVDGRITAISTAEGRAVSQQDPILAVVPTTARLRAELYVPSSAIGFLETGQTVDLAIDAFPFQRFGTLEARVDSISAAPVDRVAADGSASQAYLVIAELKQDRLIAFGQERLLISGMLLEARITAERQSLFEWLFEPLFAVQNR